MDHLQKFISQTRTRLVGIILINNAFIVLDWWIIEHFLHLEGKDFFIALGILTLVTLTLIPWVSATYLIQPTKLIWQAVLHIAPDTAANIKAPDLKHVRFGRELITALVSRIYQLASVA